MATHSSSYRYTGKVWGKPSLQVPSGMAKFTHFPTRLAAGWEPESIHSQMSEWVKSISCVRLFATPGTVALKLLCPWNIPGKITGVGCRFILQEIFPTKRLNLGLPHCRQMLYHLSQFISLPDVKHQHKWICYSIHPLGILTLLPTSEVYGKVISSDCVSACVMSY